MTDDQIKNLRAACESTPPRAEGRQVTFDPRTVIALLDEVERLRTADESDAESLAMYRRCRDERDSLRGDVERMRPVYSATCMWWLAELSEQGPEVRQRGQALADLRSAMIAHDAALGKEPR